MLLAVAAALAVCAPWLPPAVALGVLAVTFLVTPGWLVARAAFAGEPPETAYAAALALSPFLTGAPTAALLALGVPLPAAARGAALVTGVLVLVLPAPRRAPDAPAPSRAAGLAALGWTVFVAVMLLGNAWLPPRSDGWYHAATTLQVLTRGVPPEDPYFAGIRMLYFWGAHVWAAAWLALAPTLSPYAPLIAFNLAAAAAVVLAVAGFARRLGAGEGGVALSAAVATLGYAPFGWVFVVGRAMVGRVHGWGEVTTAVREGADSMLVRLATGELHASMAFFGDKYLVLTQFSMGLALFLLAVGAALALAAAPGARRTVAFGLVAAAALFLHTVVGYSIVIVAAVVGATLLPGLLRGDAAARRGVAGFVAALAVPAVLLAPYLLEITLGKRGITRPGFSAASVTTLLVGGAFIVLPGAAWLAGRARRSPDAWRLLAVGAVFALLGLAVGLPESNQSKFFNLLFLALAAPAALGWRAALWHPAPLLRTGTALLLAGGALPTAALATWAFAAEHGQSRSAWAAPSAGMREAMAWARTHTPADAAFCDLGGGRELLTVAGRSTLWGGFGGERDFGYDPAAIRARRDLAGALARGLEPGPEGAALLAGFRRDIVVMTRAGAPDSLSDCGVLATRPGRYRPLWHNADVAFWEVLR